MIKYQPWRTNTVKQAYSLPDQTDSHRYDLIRLISHSGDNRSSTQTAKGIIAGIIG